MTPSDDELRRALAPEDPGPEFTRRVMARVARLDADRRTSRRQAWRGRLVRGLAAAALLLAAGSWAQWRFGLWPGLPAGGPPAAPVAPAAGAPELTGLPAGMSPEDGERLKEELIRALRLASRKMNAARERAVERART